MYSGLHIMIGIIHFIKRASRCLIPLVFVKFTVLNPINVWMGKYDLVSSQAIFELGHFWYLLVVFLLNIVFYFAIKIFKKYRYNMSLKADCIEVCFLFILAIISNRLPSGERVLLPTVTISRYIFILEFLLQNMD